MDYEQLSKDECVEKLRELETACQELEQMRETVRRNEELYRAAFEYTGTAMLILEEDMTISVGNHKMELITGYSQDEIKSKKLFTEYVAPEDRERMLNYFKRRREGGSDVPTEYEFKLLQKDKGLRSILINVGMIPGTKRSLISLIDITDLRSSEHRFRDMAQLLPGIICEWDNSMKLTYANKKGLETFLFTEEDFKRGINLFDFVSPEDRQRAEKDIYNVYHGIYGNPVENTVRRKDGALLHLLVNSAPITEGGEIMGMRMCIIDITDRVVAEQKLRESKHRFRDTAQLLPGIICEWDNAMKLTYTNKKGLETFLLTQDDFKRGVHLFDLIQPADHERAKKDIANIYRGDYGNPAEYTVTRKDGMVFHLLVNSSPITEGGEITGMRMCVINITDRMVAEQKLRESEKRFKSIVAWSPTGIALCEKAGCLTEMNRAFCDLFDIPASAAPAEVPFSVFNAISLPADKQARLDAGESVEHETALRLEGKKGKAEGDRFFMWNITPLEKSRDSRELFIVQVHDITEKKKADEARLAEAQKETEEARHVIASLRREIMDRASFHDMVSRSPLMKDIFDILPEVAQTPATVLVTGESGTGKELVARSLHEMSNRKAKPFVAINCSALPDNLLESELFGYKAGAFTDAKKDKPGTFSRADGGTIFLDEIGDISPAMQVKLLRVLQNKTFEPLGGSQAVKVDVRIIAATNRDLSAMVKKGAFREDLFYRINVLVIKLPPLRDRRCDIPILCDHFIERFNTRYNKKIKGMSQEAANALLAHDFPGNIRELENAVEHAFVFCKEPTIGVAHLPQQFRGGAAAAGLQSISHVKDFDELEKLYLQSVLAETGGSKIKAAQKLGVHKATLFRKCKKLGIETKKDEEE
ncbi:MAG TPA: sigma 54-interacting transcriptional regulator [Chitinivibrionales bacterium]|nr:sigma 54-interacting transcriptional regulator [Chitinivibrionales bacterium]